MNNIKSILVVEDEKPLLNIIRIKLKKNGFNVITARSIKDAKDIFLKTEKIDAVWLDHYLLGKENGLDFVAWCKEEVLERSNIPIFIVSNTASPEKVKAYLMLGVDRYYIKAEKKLEEIIQEIITALDK